MTAPTLFPFSPKPTATASRTFRQTLLALNSARIALRVRELLVERFSRHRLLCTRSLQGDALQRHRLSDLTSRQPNLKCASLFAPVRPSNSYRILVDPSLWQPAPAFVRDFKVLLTSSYCLPYPSVCFLKYPAAASVALATEASWSTTITRVPRHY